MFMPCFTCLFSAVTIPLSFQLPLCACRMAYTNQESGMCKHLRFSLSRALRPAEGYKLHLLGRSPCGQALCLYELDLGDCYVSCQPFLSLIKLVLSVNNSSSAFWRGSLARLGQLE